jgi:hypothetical protein
MLWHQKSWWSGFSAVWHPVAGLVICDLLQEFSTFIFKVQVIQEEFFSFWLRDPWRWRQHSPSKCYKSLNQQHCDTSQMNRIFNYTSVKTSGCISHLPYWQGLTHVQFIAFFVSPSLAVMWHLCMLCLIGVPTVEHISWLLKKAVFKDVMPFCMVEIFWHLLDRVSSILNVSPHKIMEGRSPESSISFYQTTCPSIPAEGSLYRLHHDTLRCPMYVTWGT